MGNWNPKTPIQSLYFLINVFFHPVEALNVLFMNGSGLIYSTLQKLNEEANVQSVDT